MASWLLSNTTSFFQNKDTNDSNYFKDKLSNSFGNGTSNGTIHTENGTVDYPDDYKYQDPKLPLLDPQANFVILSTLACLGYVGNGLIILLMTHPWFRQLSYAVYLSCLAVTDSLVLTFSLIPEAYDFSAVNFDVALGKSSHLCRFWNWLWAFSSFASPWLLVLLSLDRYIAVVFPLWRVTFCTKKLALILCAVLAVLVCADATFITTGSRVEYHAKLYTDVCRIVETESLVMYFYVGSLVFRSFLPCFIILILNLQIIVVVKRGRRFRANHGNAGGRNVKTVPQTATGAVANPIKDRRKIGLKKAVGQVKEENNETDQSKTNLDKTEPNADEQLGNVEKFGQKVDPSTISHNKENREEKSGGFDKTTFALVSVALLAFCSLTPKAIFECIEISGAIEVDESNPQIYPWEFVSLIEVLNFAQNFYIMIATGPRYRAALMSYFRR